MNALHMRRTWEVDSGVNGCAGRYRGVHQVRVLQTEPGCKGSWVRASKRNPLAIGQAPRLCHNRAEVSEIGQCLPTAEETQILSAQVPETQNTSINH